MSLPATRTLWEEGREPGREMVALGVSLALTAAAVDLVITGRIGVLFDLGFVVLCLWLALSVRISDLFTVGVLPPLLMLSTFLLLAMSRSEAIARAHDGILQAVVSGLSHHSISLVLGYVLALGVLAVRQRVAIVRDETGPPLGAYDEYDEHDAYGPDDEEPGLTRSGPGRRLPV